MHIKHEVIYQKVLQILDKNKTLEFTRHNWAQTLIDFEYYACAFAHHNKPNANSLWGWHALIGD
jgi:hypothetical protein